MLLTRTLPATAAALLLMAGLASPAEARWHGNGPGHDWDRHHHNGGFFSFTYTDPGPAYLGPSPAYYLPPEPAPVYINAPYNIPAQLQDTGGNGRYCREYTTTGYIGGRAQPTYGTACLQPDGSWEIQE